MSGFRPVPPGHNITSSTNTLEQLPAALTSCPMVLVRREGHVPPLTPLYEGPYKVLFHSLRTFRLQIGNKTVTVSTQRLKPAVTSDNTIPAVPPRRGRPPLPAPPVQPAAPPRRRGRPRKAVNAPPAVAPP